MPNGKVMTRSHIIGENAVRFIQSILPSEWIARPIHPDYGIDLDIELFDYEEESCITLGEHVFLQVKGTEHLDYGSLAINDITTDVIKFPLEVSELNLVERMGSAVPVLLILVDEVNNRVYHICLNDYIRKVLPKINPKYRSQQTMTIYIPVENELSTKNVDAIRWYGKRVKIYSMFHEMLSDIDDINYMDNAELIARGKQIVEHYREYDVLRETRLWHGLKILKDTLDDLYQNDYVLKDEVSFVQHVLGYTENWENGEVFEDMEYGVNAYLYAQKISILHMGEKVKALSGTFESCCREWFMPGLYLGSHD